MAKVHQVEIGECIGSIAFIYGFHPDTIWHDPDNVELRQSRDSGYVLETGDELSIPPLKDKHHSGKVDRRHVFRRLGVPERFRMRLCELGEPLAGLAYTLDIDHVVHRGQTDEDGYFEHWISPRSKRARLVIEDDEDNAVLISLGHLAPLSTLKGFRARLINLGWLDEVAAPTQPAPNSDEQNEQDEQAPPPAGSDDESELAAQTDEPPDDASEGSTEELDDASEELDDALVEALERFQAHCELEVTGTRDEPTVRALLDIYGA